MTTPTREQVIQLLIDAGHIEGHPSDYTADIDAATIAYTAGRDQGLREAKEVCEAKHANGNRKHTHADECAAAIEQLRGK